VRQLAVLLCFVVSCALAQTDARAQPMSDPMQPPGARGAAGDARPGATRGGLQGVITSPTRNLAVIDGVVVNVGAPARDGTLSSVTDSIAVLRKNGERDVLLMHPGIDKRPSRRERP
jgi:hypothetical protein